MLKVSCKNVKPAFNRSKSLTQQHVEFQPEILDCCSSTKAIASLSLILVFGPQYFFWFNQENGVF